MRRTQHQQSWRSTVALSSLHALQTAVVILRTLTIVSLLLLLFLVLLLFHQAGRILLGDNDINRMHIERLRTQVQVVDQDAVLLSGPLRNNLSETESDELIWRCLRDAGIEKLVRGLPGQLDFLVVDGGGNFSAGERQLIALARALITQDTTSLLLCDEVVLRAFP